MLSDVNWINDGDIVPQNVWTFTYELAINMKNSTIFIALQRMSNEWTTKANRW